jgi:hypothetical protein
LSLFAKRNVSKVNVVINSPAVRFAKIPVSAQKGVGA